MGTAHGEMTIDRLLARLASLAQENARLRAAWERGGAEPGTPLSPPNVPLAALVALAARLAPAAPETPCPTLACPGSGGGETVGEGRTLRLPDHASLYQGSGRISMN